VFDDARVTAADAYQSDFRRNAANEWVDCAGTWTTDRKTRCRQAVGNGENLTVTGGPHWKEYVFGADVFPGSGGAVGLAAACRGPGEYLLFRVPTDGKGVACLLEVRGKEQAVLAEALSPVAVRPGARLKLAVTGETLTGYVENRPVVAAPSPDDVAGRAGLYARGAGTRFANAAAWFIPPRERTARIEEQFTRESTMAGWASDRGSWRPGASGVLWHTGSFHGDASVWLEPSASWRSGNPVLILGAEENEAAERSGYQLALSRLSGGRVRLVLARAGRQVAEREGAWPVEEAERRLTLRRVGSLVVGALGGALKVWLQDARPLEGARVGARVATPVAAYLGAESANCLDCTFSGPPTEWWSTRGVWDVTQRWPCDERWSFFGGLQSESPMLWTKQRFEGDLTVEAWVALYMDNPDDPKVGYTHPSDLNLSFCADGKDVSSGYSCLFAAENNTVTRILRREQVVAENRQVLMRNPVRTNLEFQRHWFYLRAEKRGARVRFFVDDQLAGEFIDPEPLGGGQVALWTWRNGLMVARARVWYQRATGPVPLPVPALPPAAPGVAAWRVVGGKPVAVVCDFEEGLGGWRTDGSGEAPILALERGQKAQGTQSLRVVNRVSGGALRAWCGIRAFDAAEFPRLQFRYRLDPAARVNVYARVGGREYVLARSTPAFAEEGVHTSDKAPNLTADGRWHHSDIDLLNVFGGIDKDQRPLVVEDLCFRAPDVEYLRSGFGGNGWGVGYYLDDFRLIGSEQTTREDARNLALSASG
jgi:hypothetical protein